MTALRADTMECSPALQRMAARAALNIHVEWREGLGFRVQHRRPFYLSRWLGKSAALATYLILVSEYSEPAADLIPPPAEVTAPPSDNAVAAAGATPRGASAAPISGAA